MRSSPLVSLWIERSRFGLSLTAIKQKEWPPKPRLALSLEAQGDQVSGAIASPPRLLRGVLLIARR